MFKLYYVPHSRCGRVRWMLEELGAPYELHRVNVAAREHRQPDYLANVHPLGHVPTLVDGDTAIFESAAIVLYLADRFPEKRLAPPSDSRERGPYYQWILYAVSELEGHCYTYMLHAGRLPEERRNPAMAEAARSAVQANIKALEGAVGDGREFLVGGFSAADVIVSDVVGWAHGLKLLDAGSPAVAWSKRLAGREANRRARAD